MRAVIFDLWDTLVEWPAEEAREADRRACAAHVGVGREEFARRWQASYRASQTGPLADVYRSLGVPDEHVDGHVAARHEFGRRVLRLRDGAAATLGDAAAPRARSSA